MRMGRHPVHKSRVTTLFNHPRPSDSTPLRDSTVLPSNYAILTSELEAGFRSTTSLLV